MERVLAELRVGTEVGGWGSGVGKLRKPPAMGTGA
jgi:hypothetical protein